MTVTRRTVDGMSSIHKPLAGIVYILHTIGEVAEIPATVVSLGGAPVFGGPIVGQFDLCNALLSRCCEKDQSKSALLAVCPTDLFETDKLEKRDCSLGIGDSDHAVEIFGHGPQVGA